MGEGENFKIDQVFDEYQIFILEIIFTVRIGIKLFLLKITAHKPRHMNCLIVDDHPFSFFALSKILEAKFPNWNILKAETTQEAITYISEQTIHLILLDLLLGEESGLTLLSYLQQTPAPQLSPCIVVSNIDDSQIIDMCMKLGACSYVHKRDAFRSIIAVIQGVLSPDGQPAKESIGNDTRRSDHPIRLTHRQRDIIDLLLNGYSNKKIAHTLDLSYGTVKNYMFDLMRIMSVNSRLEMAMKLQRSGYVPRTIQQIDAPRPIQ